MKKNNHETTAGDPAMAQFRRYQAALVDTGVRIPQLLQEQRSLRAELGQSEISGADVQEMKERLDAIAAGLESAGRQRGAASDGLLFLADGLREARAIAAQELAGVAQSTVGDFQVRWARAVAELSRLHAEAAMLSRALRTNVPTAPPYIASLSADGTRMQVVFSGHIETDAVHLPPQVAAITERIDQFDDAASLCAAVAQAREWDARYVAMQRTRSGSMPVMTGTYVVNKRFTHLGGEFQPGDLVDQSLMGAGVLHRRWQARELLPLETAATVAG